MLETCNSPSKLCTKVGNLWTFHFKCKMCLSNGLRMNGLMNGPSEMVIKNHKMHNVYYSPNCVNRDLDKIRTNAQLIIDVGWRELEHLNCTNVSKMLQCGRKPHTNALELSTLNKNILNIKAAPVSHPFVPGTQS